MYMYTLLISIMHVKSPMFLFDLFVTQTRMTSFSFGATLLIALVLLYGDPSLAAGTADGSEQWSYVQVRPKAHMFWWLYSSPYRVEDASKPWPIILWLQGGPGGSGVGTGNFREIGPLDGNLNPRNSTWLRKADLLFVDSPVGTGYSYVDDVHDKSLTVKTDEEAATDVTTLLKELFNENEALQQSPLYVVGESYGGKFAVTVGLSTLKAIEAGELKLKLGGIALGDSWISPEDYVQSWGPLLKTVSRIDSFGLVEATSIAQAAKQQVANEQYKEATNSFFELENVISDSSGDIDFYNFMLDYENDPIVGSTSSSSVVRYTEYLDSYRASSAAPDMYTLLNGVIREKLKIIPTNISWGRQNNIVFPALAGDFMKPRIQEVDELLAKGVNITIYNGQLDIICSTPGTEAWVEKLKWEGLKNFLSLNRTALYCGGDYSARKGFVKSYKNLNFYWILGAGHFVPVDQPCVSLEMIGNISQSPNTSL